MLKLTEKWDNLSQQKKEIIAAYLFLLPSIFVFIFFLAGPIAAVISLSLLKWDLLSSPIFVGLNNFIYLFRDERGKEILKVTFFFVLGSISIKLIMALFLAVGVNHIKNISIRYILRSAYFLPVLTPLATVSVVWAWMFHANFGIINYYLRTIGLPNVNWLNSTAMAKWSVLFVNIWWNVGFYFVVFLAGLQNIPQHLYESAKIDGATNWKQFQHITLPLLSPVILFSLIIALIGEFQLFDPAYVLTKGGPGDASRPIVYYLYEVGFRSFKMGYGSAIAVFFLGIILCLTLLLLKSSKYWVFYYE